MKIYHLKHNGFTFGQKKGKNEAVKAMEKHLSFTGHAPDKCGWLKNTQGIAIVIKDNDYDLFSIEEAH